VPCEKTGYSTVYIQLTRQTQGQGVCPDPGEAGKDQGATSVLAALTTQPDPPKVL
jgi:hypothetical protein